ncbi:MAG: HIT family protein [Bacillota bacterium]
MTDCVFCKIESLDIIAENKLALAFYDASPVSKGHTLVIPRRHANTYFDVTPDEHLAMFKLIKEVKKYLDKRYRPDAYNIGANVGSAAGQTIFHFHFHVIPRYEGDVPDPRGGVRKVIPNRSHHPVNNRETLH